MQLKPTCVLSSSICLSALSAKGDPIFLRCKREFLTRQFAFVHSQSDNSIALHPYSNRHKQSSANLLGTHQRNMSDETIALRQRKQALRKEVRKCIREAYPPNGTEKLITQSNLVFSRLFDLPQYQTAKSIGFFLSMPSGEIQTREAIGRIVRDGKVLYVPRVGLDFEKCDMDLVRADTSVKSADDDCNMMFYDTWPKNKWNIPEPPMNDGVSNIARPGDIDLLLVPGLAFDPNGHRLGQGKGYYDRFISKMRQTTPVDMNTTKANSAGDAKPFLVGVCLEEQYLDQEGFEGIPVTDHDFVMDMIITSKKVIDCSSTEKMSA